MTPTRLRLFGTRFEIVICKKDTCDFNIGFNHKQLRMDFTDIVYMQIFNRIISLGVWSK